MLHYTTIQIRSILFGGDNDLDSEFEFVREHATQKVWL